MCFTYSGSKAGEISGTSPAKRFEMSQPGIVYAVKKGEKTAKENNYQLPK